MSKNAFTEHSCHNLKSGHNNSFLIVACD